MGVVVRVLKAGWIPAVVLGASLAAACGDEASPGSGFVGAPDSGPASNDDAPNFGGGGGDGAVDALVFDPPTVTLTLDGKNPGVASFTLKATINGSVSAVLPESIQFDRPDLAKGAIGNPVQLTAPGDFAGTGTLHGVFHGKEATAKLIVQVAVVDVQQGVNQQIVSALNAPNLGQDPQVSSLLYPYDQTVFPLGLGSPLVMWPEPSASDVYRVHFEEQGYTYDAYTTAPLPGQWRLAQAAWDKLTASNQADPLKITLSRYDMKSMQAYSSAHEAWTVAPASLRGAIYYWTTSAGGHMSRIRPGTGAQPEVLNNGKCMGCHAVSADGSTLVAAIEGQPTNDGSNDNRAWVSFPLPAANKPVASTYFAANVAVNPDGKYTVFGTQVLKLGDTKTGQRLTGSGLETLPVDAGMSGFMTPAFSPNGKKLAMVEGKGNWYHNLINGKLVVADFDEATVKFSNLVGLAPASTFPANQRAIAYPSFTPDSQYLSFHVSDYATGCDVQGCTDAAKQIGSLWLQNINGAAPVKLDKLNDSAPNAADHNLSLEPTFNPVERGGYFWVVFTSMRDWGNRLTGVVNNGKKRLWVAAIDKNIGAIDPSHPPFFLEGQEEQTTNMRGFWALAACIPTQGGGACSGGFECCSGFCDKGACVDTGTIACKGTGDVCGQTSDCCNAPLVQCLAGTCQIPSAN